MTDDRVQSQLAPLVPDTARITLTKKPLCEHPVPSGLAWGIVQVEVGRESDTSKSLLAIGAEQLVVSWFVDLKERPVLDLG